MHSMFSAVRAGGPNGGFPWVVQMDGNRGRKTEGHELSKDKFDTRTLWERAGEEAPETPYA